MLTYRDDEQGASHADCGRTNPDYLANATVADVISERLVAVTEDEALYDVMLRMRSYGVRRIPVIDGAGVLQGIIAFDDLLEHVADELAKLASLLQREATRERDVRPALKTLRAPRP